jgi:cytochrome P450
MMVSSRPAGHLRDDYNPFVPPQLDDPYPIWERCRSESRAFYSPVLDAWIVTNYADIVTILRNPSVFGSVASRKMFGKACAEADAILAALPPMEETNPLSSEPPVHTKLRRYLQPAFQPHRVAPLEPELKKIAHNLVTTFEPLGHGDFYADYAYRYPLMVVCRLVGVPVQDQEQVKEWAGQRIELRNADLPEEEQVRAAHSQRAFYDYSMDLVRARRNRPGADLLSWIIQDSDSSDDPLTEPQLASQVISLLTAGHETTAHWLVLSVRRLLADRPRWQALTADPTSASKAELEESLRIDGPVQAIWRKVKADTEIGGVAIPAGSRVSLILGSANADEKVFDQPREYCPSRPNAAQHLTFGRGPHTCAGAGIARLEGRISLEVLASRLPALRLASDDGLAFRPNATQRMPYHLYVEWD